jgi:hypothetical protein
MAKKKEQTLNYKILHIKLNIELHKTHYKPGRTQLSFDVE